MTYEATITHHGEVLLKHNSHHSDKLLAWVLSRLELEDYQYATGVIRNQSDVHEPPRVYTAHNPHFD